MGQVVVATPRAGAVAASAMAAGLMVMAAFATAMSTPAAAAICTVSGPSAGPVPPTFAPAQIVSGSFSFGPGLGPFATSVSLAPFDTSLGSFGFATFDLVGSGTYTLPVAGLEGCPGGSLEVGLAVDLTFDNGVTVSFAAANLSGTIDVVPRGVSVAAGLWSVETSASEAWLVPPVSEIGVIVDPIFSMVDPSLLPLAADSKIDGFMTLTVAYFYAPPGYILGPGGVLIPIGDGGGDGGGGGPTPGVEIPVPAMHGLLALGAGGLALARRGVRNRRFA